ncbi:aldehyde dehydrogenase family protein [Agromyces protaetiae]|uniref:Aldehyde dehydrogenase family protein n=1 Tax=Agromyces protaetiae TaxID=2509455 RepID=A0A4P6FBR0_9MICO|nr:aldehyde dehydrogenase family protein [Agromyces protaetiae]QAY73422.1 aldehyde dehydrogenase family protein [Agromyces protaetiae]
MSGVVETEASRDARGTASADASVPDASVPDASELPVRTLQLFIGGEWTPGLRTRVVSDRWTGEPVAIVSEGAPEHAVAAVDAAAKALATAFPVPDRARVLAAAAANIQARAEDFAQAITAETGKPVTAARGEVGRGVETLSWAAEEAKRLPGETVRLDAIAAGAGTMAFTVPEARGVVAAITPFNFPLNLVLHKVAPALAAGCSVVLKPSDKAVVVAVLLVEAFADAGLPAGRLNLVSGPPASVVEPWLSDPRVAVVTFTGSSAVGWDLKRRSPEKLHVLELGSNTALVVTDSADAERAAADAATAALANSGQACVSLQRIYVTSGIAERFTAALAERFRQTPVGDPRDPATVVGPLITDSAASHLAATVEASVATGGRLLTGGTLDGGVLHPTLLADVAQGDPIVCEEAFGPVASVIVVGDLDEAIAAVNDSEYALNTAIHTSDLGEAMAFAERAEAGSVLVNMPPSFRADHMPYGGVKGSGQGTEGVRYAIHELLHEKLVVLKP